MDLPMDQRRVLFSSGERCLRSASLEPRDLESAERVFKTVSENEADSRPIRASSSHSWAQKSVMETLKGPEERERTDLQVSESDRGCCGNDECSKIGELLSRTDL